MAKKATTKKATTKADDTTATTDELESVVPSSGPEIEKFRTKVVCNVRGRSQYDVKRHPMIPVFTHPETLRRGVTTYYEADQVHVMPYAHALDLVQAGLVVAGSIMRVSAGKADTPFTGVIRRPGENAPVPKASRRKPEYESAAPDVDDLPEADAWGDDGFGED